MSMLIHCRIGKSLTDWGISFTGTRKDDGCLLPTCDLKSQSHKSVYLLWLAQQYTKSARDPLTFGLQRTFTKFAVDFSLSLQALIFLAQLYSPTSTLIQQFHDFTVNCKQVCSQLSYIQVSHSLLCFFFSFFFCKVWKLRFSGFPFIDQFPLWSFV